MIKILEYQKEHKEIFRKLGEEWISQHFELIDHDLHILADPEGTIISKGGQIIFAELDGEIIGTAALVLKPNDRFELAKLGVTEKAKRKGIGRLLTEEIIKRAKKAGAQSLFLESNRVLKPAILLYEKIGFVEVNPEAKTPQCDIEMKLSL